VDRVPDVLPAAGRLDQRGGLAEAREAQGDVLAAEDVGVVAAHSLFFCFSRLEKNCFDGVGGVCLWNNGLGQRGGFGCATVITRRIV
jgi:hypothetical protein